MELKYGREEQHGYTYEGSNRTFMELKLQGGNAACSVPFVLIAPLWN